MAEPRITDEQANAYATQSTWPAGQELTITKALMWLGADLLDARHEIERLENEDMAQEREYRRVVEIESGRLRQAVREFLRDIEHSAMGTPWSWRSYDALRKELDG